MKKKYSKPGIIIEDFAIAQNIAQKNHKKFIFFKKRVSFLLLSCHISVTS
mgnify:CR=1 FL=1